MSFDSDRELDDWSFFTMVAEELEEFRRRVKHKLDGMAPDRRKELLSRVGGEIAKIDYELRQGCNAARKAAGGRPRALSQPPRPVIISRD